MMQWGLLDKEPFLFLSQSASRMTWSYFILLEISVLTVQRLSPHPHPSASKLPKALISELCTSTGYVSAVWTSMSTSTSPDICTRIVPSASATETCRDFPSLPAVIVIVWLGMSSTPSGPRASQEVVFTVQVSSYSNLWSHMIWPTRARCKIFSNILTSNFTKRFRPTPKLHWLVPRNRFSSKRSGLFPGVFSQSLRLALKAKEAAMWSSQSCCHPSGHLEPLTEWCFNMFQQHSS